MSKYFRDRRHQFKIGDTGTLEPSGSFAAAAGPIDTNFNIEGPLELYNFGLKGGLPVWEQVAMGADAYQDGVARARELVGAAEFKVVEEDAQFDLGDALLTLASRIALGGHNLVLFPLRGGEKLRQCLVGMLPEHPRFESILFSEAASVPQNQFYLELLKQAIRSSNSDLPEFRLAVVDAGDSGAGTRKMIELLQQTHEDDWRRQRWIVVFHVFYR